MSRVGRAVHAVTFAVAASALALQLALVVRGHAVLDDVEPPALGTRLVRFLSYFTILSNLLVAVTSLQLTAGRWHGRLFRALRVDAIAGIAVTAVVHWFLLRPLLDLHGADALADTLLHVVVPALTIGGWLLVGPRGLVSREDLLPSAAYPAAYLVWSLAHGAVTDWYAYPFVDVTEHGYAVVLLNAVGVIALLALVAAGMIALDRRLPGDTVSGSPRARPPGSARPGDPGPAT
jgi:hypothetical protein